VKRNNIKILFINSGKYVGGGEISLINFLSALDRRYYQTTVICSSGKLFDRLTELKINAVALNLIPLKPFMIQSLKHNSFAINPLAFFLNSIIMVVNTYRLFKVVAKINPDVMHVNTMKDIAHVFGINILRKIPTVWHVRVIPDKDRITARKYVKYASSFVCRIIAISNAVAHGVRCLGVDAKKIEIVYNPIDTNRFRPRPKRTCRRKHHLPIKARIIGSLGRLYREKGYELLLQAVAHIKTEFDNVHVLVAGNTWEKGYVETLRDIAHRLGLSRHLTILQWQSDAATLISALDILVLSPLCEEAFGRILAEAMACEIPAIGADIGGISEVVHNNITGLLVQPRNVEAVAQALSTLLENHTLSKSMAVRSREYVIANFDTDHHVAKMVRIYAELTRETNVAAESSFLSS
jgi:glycosyltransferase involved in cell wall biosynthesis